MGFEGINRLGDMVSAGSFYSRTVLWKKDVCLYIVSYRKGCVSSGCLIWGGFLKTGVIGCYFVGDDLVKRLSWENVEILKRNVVLD